MKLNNCSEYKSDSLDKQDVLICVNHKQYKVSDLINDFYDVKKLVEENHRLLLELYNR